ncbi:MAG: hypothetical protein WC071_10485 [Victivallaceae bacterium]
MINIIKHEEAKNDDYRFADTETQFKIHTAIETLSPEKVFL